MNRALLITFFIFGLTFNGHSQKETIDEIVSVVGSEIILSSDIQIQKNQLKQQGYKGNITDCQVLEEILFEKLMLNQAKIDSVEVTEQMVQSELDKRLRVFIRQIGSQEKLEEYYGKSIGEIREEFYGVLKDQILVQRMESQISQQTNVTPRDVKDFYNSIPADSLPFVSASVELAQIVQYPEESRAEVERVRSRLNKFREEVQTGNEDFETLAVLYSQDPGSASKGGSLGLKPRGSFVPEFDAVAFNLEEGEISAPFETDFGYHIMQMVELRGEMYNANHILLKPKVTSAQLTQAQAELDSIRNLVVRDSISFALAASKYSDDERTANQNGMMVNEGQGSTIFEMDQLDPKIFLAIDTLEIDQVSNAFYFQDERGKQGYRVVKLVTRTEPHRANLQDDYQNLQNMTAQQLKAKTMDDWMRRHIRETYIKVNEQYQSCSFGYPWLSAKDEAALKE